MSETGNEFYRKYRPKKFSDVIGQPDAVRVLIEMGKNKEIPHALLFTGPSGCGKTTLARIVREKLKCSDYDYSELNAADFRGIDAIRDMRGQMGTAPLGGSCRIWLLDECHSLTGDAQNALLKLLEDTPSHVYFLLCTTDPQKLKKTVITRCTEVRCRLLTEAELGMLVRKIAAAEGATLSDKVVESIANAADGSARKALVILNAVARIQVEEEQLAAISAADVKGQAIEIARALTNSKTTWSDMKEIIKKVDDDPEGIRRLVLGYCKSIMVGSGGNLNRVALVMEEFRDPLYDIGLPGLVLACYNVVTAK